MSCGARLPVYIVFIGAFFSNNSGSVLWLIYTLGLVMAILLGLVLKKTVYKGVPPVFIMELPPYRMPTIRDLCIHTWQKLKHFIIKAGTYILACSIIIWFLLNLPWGVRDKKDSILGKFGNAIAPVFKPLGFGNWEASSSLITGLIAKEVVVSTMTQIYVEENGKIEKNEKSPKFSEDLLDIGKSFLIAVHHSFENIFSGLGIKSLTTDESEDELEERNLLRQKLQNVFTPLSAFTFIVFVLLYWPCIVVGIAMRQEFSTWKVYLTAAIVHSTLAWIVAFIIYNGGMIFL